MQHFLQQKIKNNSLKIVVNINLMTIKVTIKVRTTKHKGAIVRGKEVTADIIPKDDICTTLC